MRKLYGSTNWRRVLAFVLVFAMMFSAMGTSGYSVFAESPDETGEAVYEAEPEVVEPEVTEDDQGPSPGEEAAEIAEPVEEAEEAAEGEDIAEPVEEAEEAAEGEDVAEPVEEAEEAAEGEAAAEPAEEAEEAAEGEEAAEPAEEAEEAAEGEEIAEPAEEAEGAGEGEEVAEPVEEVEEGAEPAEAAEETEESEEIAEPVEEAEKAAEATLIEEASQVIIEDDGSEAEAVETGSLVEEFANGLDVEAAEPAEAEEVLEAEPAEKVEIAYPAMGFRDIIGGISVTVDAPEGAFPAGTEMKLAEVEIETILDAVTDAVDGKIAKIKAVDITFFYEDKEIQPLLPISVVMNASGMDADSERKVLHIDESGSEPVAEVIDTADTSEKAVVFEADSFSVYVVIDFVVPRLTLTFMSGGEAIAEMIIKGSDTADEVDTIIYDPGAGEIPEGQVFKGWTTDSQYTAESKLLTIEDVRKEAMTAVDELVNDEYVTDKYVTYYAAIFKQFTVKYIDGDGVAVGSEVAEIPAHETEAIYKVNQAYTTDENHNFEGWIVLSGESNIKNYPDNADSEVIDNQTIYYYPNGKEITITGNIRFSVNAPQGYWLVFDANGKGGTYNAPRFIKAEDVTSAEGLLEMKKKGYTFVDWYTGAPEEEGGNPTGEVFKFGYPLTGPTTIYAMWEPNEEANYTIIIWKQKVGSAGKTNPDPATDYDFVTSFVGTGPVGASIVENEIAVNTIGELDYVTIGNGENPKQFGGITSVANGTVSDPLTGFTLSSSLGIEDEEINAAGTAMVNVYFDRMQYTIKLYVTRTNNTGTGGYAGSSAAGNTFAGNWSTNLTRMTTVNGSAPETFDEEGNNRYYYHPITAYYGQKIEWPSYGEINSSAAFVSWLLMHTAKGYRGNSNGLDTLKGEITVMDEQMLGDLSSSEGNYATARYGASNEWHYYIYFADANGNYPAEESPDKDIEVHSNNTTESSQTAPTYDGYDYVSEKTVYNRNPLYMRYYYKPTEYSILYLDGQYIDGNDLPIANQPDLGKLGEKPKIPYGADISTYAEYRPDAEHTPEGYVFEGWYTDKGCIHEYEFKTMPQGGVTLYAKWRIVEYRVFLHPNAYVDEVKDTSLSWGDETSVEKQQMSFRRAFGDKISLPTGTRDDYEFYGWYKDEEFKEAYAPATILNDLTVTAAYDKTQSTELDKWGDVKEELNKDADRNWITRKIDLYAKWSAIVVGADGIGVAYDVGEGTNAPLDTAHYIDNASVSAGAAPKAPAGKVFDRWVLQTWNGTEYADTETEVLAGETFTILKSDAKITDAETDELVDPKDVNKEGEYKYTVQLKAVYKDIEEETPTHIKWYSNYGSENDGKGTLYQEDTDLKINEAVLIYGFENETESWTIPTRAGYKFLGWTKTKGGKTPDFLTWVEESEDEEGYAHYVAIVDGEEIFADLVAADEKQPYEDLYAVWEPIEVNYTVEFYYQSEDGTAYVKDGQMTEVRKAKTESEVKATDEDKAKTQNDQYKLVEGSPSVLSAIVAGDGSTVLKLYFNLKGLHLKLDKKVANKPANGEAFALGETIEYQITVTNDGELTANKFVVADDLTGDEIEIESLAPGESKSFKVEYIVTEEDILKGKITNKASIKPQSPVDPPDSPDNPPDTPEMPGTPEIPVTPHDPVIVVPEAPNAHATITKDTAADQPKDKLYERGDEIFFEVTVTNDGNLTITNIVVTDELTHDEWTIKELAPGRSETFTCKSYKVTLQNAIEAKVENVATGTGEGPEDYEATIEDGTKTVDIVPIGKTINVAFYTNYPPDVTMENEYTDTMTVEVPYTVPGFVEVFDESKLAPNYEFTGWEIHSPGDAKEAENGAVVPAESSSLASASSSSQKTEPEDANFIFYAQWKAVPPPEEEPEPDIPTPPRPNPPRPNPSNPTPPEPEPPVEEPDDEIVDDEPPLANYEEEPDDEIDEEPTPLSPYTGDDRHTAAWGFVSLLSLAGIVLVTRKRREEE